LLGEWFQRDGLEEISAMVRKPRIALITGWTNPERRSIVEICSKLLYAMEPFSSKITWVVTNLTAELSLDNNVTLLKLESKYIPRDASSLRLIPYYLLHQFKLLWTTLRLLPETVIFVFATGADLFFLPMLLIRIAGKKVIIRSDGRPSFVVNDHFQRPGKIKVALIRMGETISYQLANRILPESECMIHLYNLERYSSKTSFWSQYIDTTTFKKRKNLSERTYDVGYIGRLIKEKGALKFVEALLPVLRDRECKAIIIGDGYLRNEIEQFLSGNNMQNQVDLLGWVENKQIPDYLNDIKLVVVPSDYEGLPSGVLEAMACGTPVLATPVGGIPDLIREGETGFFMENNTPERIAKNIIRSLSHPDLEQISRNAQVLIEQQYTYEAAATRYKNVLESLN